MRTVGRLLVLGFAVRAGPAAACDCDPFGVPHTVPREGAVGVPVNARVVVFGARLASDAPILRRPDGRRVPVTVRDLGLDEPAYEVVPLAPLDPNTTYTLIRPKREYIGDATSFTTGVRTIGAGPGPLSPPRFEVEHRRVDGDDCEGSTSLSAAVGEVPGVWYQFEASPDTAFSAPYRAPSRDSDVSYGSCGGPPTAVLGAWWRVRAVDFAGNPGPWTSAVQGPR